MSQGRGFVGSGSPDVDRSFNDADRRVGKLEDSLMVQGLLVTKAISTVKSVSVGAENILVFSGTAAGMLTLPKASSYGAGMGKWIFVANPTAYSVTLTPQRGDTVSANATLAAGQHAVVVSDGRTTWHVSERRDAAVMPTIPDETGFGFESYRHGTVATYEAWYWAGVGACAQMVDTPAQTGANQAILYAVPFVAPRRGGTLDRLGAYVASAGSASNFRLGLYSNKGNGDLYPGARLADSGSIPGNSVGAQTATVSVALTAGALYWAVIIHEGFAVYPTFRQSPVDNMSSFLGTSNALGVDHNIAIQKANAFGTLPATFPSGGSVVTALPLPAIAYRIS